MSDNGLYYLGHHWEFGEVKCANCGAKWPFNTLITKRIKEPCPSSWVFDNGSEIVNIPSNPNEKIRGYPE